MASISSYPHVEMHVRDDSTAVVASSSFWPVSKPLYIMRTARGPVGKPIWCPTYTDAVKTFGADTFDKHSKFYSEDAYYLKKTMPMNGAYIMRVVDNENAVNAHVSIELGLSKGEDGKVATVDIPLYKRDCNGNFELTFTGEKVPINAGGYTEEEWTKAGKTEPWVAATIKGLKVAWRAIARDGISDTRDLGSLTTKSTDKFIWYPMVDILASNPGSWGSSYGVKLYFSKEGNGIATTITRRSAQFAIAPVELLSGATVYTPITDKFGQTICNGVIKKDVTDPDMGTELTLDKRLSDAYAGKYALPLKFFWNRENWNTVGSILMNNELLCRDDVHAVYGDLLEEIESPNGVLTTKTFVDQLYSKYAEFTDIKAEDGYMVNVCSCTNFNSVPFFAAEVVDSEDADVKSDEKLAPFLKDIILPTTSTSITLKAGDDGSINDWNIEEYIRAQIAAAVSYSQDYLNDYWRCRFNVMYDTGWSIKTKKAAIDFTAVRDNLVVNIGTQTSWKAADQVGDVVPNKQQDDESIAANLRAYALLMKEDIENGVGACRVKIFCHAGKTSDHDQWMPYTLWMALKDAEYLNRDFIDQEPKELPRSGVECFTETSWIASQEDTKARVWNSGVNYVQCYEGEENLHFAAVRTVYANETSILVDAGVVNALTFMKDIVRREWSNYAGSTRKAEVLDADIAKKLTSRCAYMLHGKFESNVSVYETTEDTLLGDRRHVDLELWSAGQNRVWKATIIAKRYGLAEEA